MTGGVVQLRYKNIDNYIAVSGSISAVDRSHLREFDIKRFKYQVLIPENAVNTSL